MTEETALDRAHARMQADEDATSRMGFYERLADAELFLLLEAMPEDTQNDVTPVLFEQEGNNYVLVFDREHRLAEYAGGPAPYVGLSGRSVVGMLAGQSLGLGVNLSAPSAILLPASAMDWLNGALGNSPQAVEARIESLETPGGLPDMLLMAIDTKLAIATGLAQCAWLTGVRYTDGTRGHLLAFVGALPEAETALVQAASEALTFSGIEAGAMDVGFFGADDPVVPRLARVGLRFDLPQPDLQQSTQSAPGSDPDRPPKLK